MKIIWSIDFNHWMKPVGQRILFSQLIFLQPLQFDPDLNSSLGKIPWLSSSIKKNSLILSLWHFLHRQFFRKYREIKNLRKIVFILRRNTKIFSSCWCTKARLCCLLQSILLQNQLPSPQTQDPYILGVQKCNFRTNRWIAFSYGIYNW